MVQNVQINQCNTLHWQEKSFKKLYFLNRIRKSIWQNSVSSHSKSSYQRGNRGKETHLNTINIIYETHSQYNTQQWKAKSYPTKVWNKTRMPILTTSLQHNLRSSNHSNQKRKKKKNGREEVNLSPYADIVVVQSPTHVQLFGTPMACSMPGLPVPHHLLKFSQVHVHRIGDAVQPSHPLTPTSPALNLSQHQGLFQWVIYSHQMTKILELQH